MYQISYLVIIHYFQNFFYPCTQISYLVILSWSYHFFFFLQWNRVSFFFFGWIGDFLSLILSSKVVLLHLLLHLQFSLLCYYLGTFYSVLVLWLKYPFKNFIYLVSINNGFSNSRYDAEAIYFDGGVRSAKRKQLEEKLLQVINLLRCSLLNLL